MDIVKAYPGWFVAGAIVVIGLIVLGFKDTIRFSLKRAWAISGVCFDESIRRKVLWITPLAMLGVIIVSQLQKPFDELDAIRQTTKFSLFATGLVLVVAILILACTSLPREIENRVIYTIVTKPTTRLELVFGKILGFARVSAAILILMGLFTYAYLHLRSNRMRAYVAERLARNDVELSSRPTLEHYKQAGLLSSKTYAVPATLDIYGRASSPSQPFHWMSGEGEQNFLVPFDLTRDELIPPGAVDAAPGAAGLSVLVRMDYQNRLTTPAPAADPPDPSATAPAEQAAVAGPPVPGSPPATAPAVAPPLPPKPSEDKPYIQVQLLSAHEFTLIPPTYFGDKGKPVLLPAYSSNQPAQIYLGADHVMAMAQHIPPVGSIRVYVMVEGMGKDIEYKVGEQPVQLYIPGANGTPGRVIDPAHSKTDPSQSLPLIFRGRSGTYGQQLKGGKDVTAVAVYAFRKTPRAQAVDGSVPFELRTNIERDEDASETKSDITDISLNFLNLDTHKTFLVTAQPESMRTTYISAPADAVAGGNFNVTIRSLTDGHWVGLKADSLQMVTANQPFAWNLFKSLLVMWLMSLLVIVVAIFCSTFLSWPIAVVLTLVILLGHWCVQEMGDALGPGAGNYIVTDFGFQDPSTAKVVSKSVDAMAKALNTMAVVLPDISKFSSTEDIVRGVSLPPLVLWESLEVLLMFGLPLGVAAFVILKHKEVAP